MRHLCLECHDTACYYRGAPYPLLDKRPDDNSPWQGHIRKRAMQSPARAPSARSDCNRVAGRLRDYTRVENDNTRMPALAPNRERLRRSPALGAEYEPFGLLLMSSGAPCAIAAIGPGPMQQHSAKLSECASERDKQADS